jgi:RNA polymerase sigma factor (sigma-70 family)
MINSIPTTDHKLFVAQVTPLIPPLRGFAKQLTRDDDQLHDLVQDTLLTAYRFYNQFEQGTNLKGWLFKIMKNQFINQVRGHRLFTISFSEEGCEYLLDITTDADRQRIDVFSDEVQSAFFALKDEFREVLILSDLEDMSCREISEKLNMPEGTVKSRIHRARKALQQSLAGYACTHGYQVPERMSRGFYASKSREVAV